MSCDYSSTRGHPSSPWQISVTNTKSDPNENLRDELNFTRALTRELIQKRPRKVQINSRVRTNSSRKKFARAHVFPREDYKDNVFAPYAKCNKMWVSGGCFLLARNCNGIYKSSTERPL